MGVDSIIFMRPGDRPQGLFRRVTQSCHFSVVWFQLFTPTLPADCLDAADSLALGRGSERVATRRGCFLMTQKPKKETNKKPTRKKAQVTGENSPEKLPTRTLPEILESVRRSFEKKIVDESGFKPTLAEYLKLLQMQREMDTEESLPREIRVTWVDPPELSEET